MSPLLGNCCAAVADRKASPCTQIIAVRVGALGYWPVLVMYAVRTGFAGALSTVSTFVAEVSCTPIAAASFVAQCSYLMFRSVLRKCCPS